MHSNTDQKLVPLCFWTYSTACVCSKESTFNIMSAVVTTFFPFATPCLPLYIVFKVNDQCVTAFFHADSQHPVDRQLIIDVDDITNQAQINEQLLSACSHLGRQGRKVEKWAKKPDLVSVKTFNLQGRSFYCLQQVPVYGAVGSSRL